MDTKQKDAIAAACLKYLEGNNMIAAEFSRKSGVSETYISLIKRGIYVNGTSDIKDVHFMNIAKACEYSAERKYWSHINTYQYSSVIVKLDEAHKHSCLNTIIGATGTGKSYAVERYRSIHPNTTLVVTVNSMDDVSSVMSSLLKQLKLKLRARQPEKLRALVEMLKKKHQQGQKYLIIIDEAENTKIPAIRAFKALYDLIVKPGYCGMALVGTNGLLKNLDRFDGQEGIPQFKDRIQTGIKEVDNIEPKEDYTLFFESMGIQGEGFQKLLIRLCGSYRTLHDYLERALRVADELGKPLDEELFREIYNL